MYQVYFYNRSGQYQVPIYLESDEAVIGCVFRYIRAVPKILVTENDEIVMETEDGSLLHPEFDEETFEGLRKRITAFSPLFGIDEYLDVYQSQVAEFEESGGREREVFESMIKIEIELLALAAQQGVDLSLLGWKNSGVVEAEVDAQSN